MVAQRHSPEALAEHLHQRWLADARFAPVAASIVLHIHRVKIFFLKTNEFYPDRGEGDGSVLLCPSSPSQRLS